VGGGRRGLAGRRWRPARSAPCFAAVPFAPRTGRAGCARPRMERGGADRGLPAASAARRPARPRRAPRAVARPGRRPRPPAPVVRARHTGDRATAARARRGRRGRRVARGSIGARGRRRASSPGGSGCWHSPGAMMRAEGEVWWGGRGAGARAQRGEAAAAGRPTHAPGLAQGGRGRVLCPPGGGEGIAGRVSGGRGSRARAGRARRRPKRPPAARAARASTWSGRAATRQRGRPATERLSVQFHAHAWAQPAVRASRPARARRRVCRPPPIAPTPANPRPHPSPGASASSARPAAARAGVGRRRAARRGRDHRVGRCAHLGVLAPAPALRRPLRDPGAPRVRFVARDWGRRARAGASRAAPPPNAHLPHPPPPPAPPHTPPP